MKRLGFIFAVILLQPLLAAAAASNQFQISGDSHDGTVSTCTGLYAGEPPAESLSNVSCEIQSGTGPVAYDGSLYVTVFTDDTIFPWVCSGKSLDEMSCSRTSGPSGG